eukprot:m.253195 g.253195  ORF g.253195 m.253195 type:complete len:502 (+) comp40368_c2_seq9:3206-4711(+)
MARQPVMVDGSELRCEGTSTANLRIGSKSFQHSFYVVRDMPYGIFGTDILAHLEVKIDVANKKLIIDGSEILVFEPAPQKGSSCSLVGFGQVYSVTEVVVMPGQESVIWGKVHSSLRKDWTGIVERLMEKTGLLGCPTLSEGKDGAKVPVRVLNITDDPIRVHRGQHLAEFTEASVLGIDGQQAPYKQDDRLGPESECEISDSLTVDERRRLKELLKEYQQLFACPGNGGRVECVEHTIPLVSEDPVTCRPRRLPTHWKDEVEAEVQRLHTQGIIRPSASPFAAPICPVRKNDGTLRLCIDYRALNARTRNTAIPTGNLTEVIESLSGARFFSTIDLAKGYFQVPVSEQDKAKTAFRSPSGLWEFNRMPFGLKGAPSTFCQMMQLVVGRLSPLQLVLYMDDLCVMSESFEEHLVRLKNLFEALKAAGLRMNGKKCRLAIAMKKVRFCGSWWTLRVSDQFRKRSRASWMLWFHGVCGMCKFSWELRVSIVVSSRTMLLLPSL